MSAQLPIFFRVAQLVRGLPDFPGRDTVLEFLLGRDAGYPDATISGSFGGGLRYEGNPVLDRTILEMPLLRFGRPALSDLIDGVLMPGDVFADVGGNQGLYTLWAARRVGATGHVDSFEPMPPTAATLQRNVELNGFDHAEVNNCAVGSSPGTIQLFRMDGVSGRTSRYVHDGNDPFDVSVVTLDDYYASRRSPLLIKIDVEGMEYEVLQGAAGLLGSDAPPMVVFESNAEFFRAAGASYREVLDYLAGFGFAVYALAPAGLALEPPDAQVPGGFNVLAVRRDHPSHAAALQRLARTRFPENQSA